MGFQVSPGVQVKEIDLTNVIPAVSTSIGGLAGIFTKGPIGEVITVGSEKELVSIFGEPDYKTYEYFFAAANFLKYGNTLRIINAEATSVKPRNAFAGTYDVKAMEFPNAGVAGVMDYINYHKNFGNYWNDGTPDNATWPLFVASAGPYVKNKADFDKQLADNIFDDPQTEDSSKINWLARNTGNKELLVSVIPSSYSSIVMEGEVKAAKYLDFSPFGVSRTFSTTDSAGTLQSHNIGHTYFGRTFALNADEVGTFNGKVRKWFSGFDIIDLVTQYNLDLFNNEPDVPTTFTDSATLSECRTEASRQGKLTEEYGWYTDYEKINDFIADSPVGRTTRGSVLSTITDSTNLTDAVCIDHYGSRELVLTFNNTFASNQSTLNSLAAATTIGSPVAGALEVKINTETLGVWPAAWESARSGSTEETMLQISGQLGDIIIASFNNTTDTATVNAWAAIKAQWPKLSMRKETNGRFSIFTNTDGWNVPFKAHVEEYAPLVSAADNVVDAQYINTTTFSSLSSEKTYSPIFEIGVTLTSFDAAGLSSIALSNSQTSVPNGAFGSGDMSMTKFQERVIETLRVNSQYINKYADKFGSTEVDTRIATVAGTPGDWYEIEKLDPGVWLTDTNAKEVFVVDSDSSDEYSLGRFHTVNNNPLTLLQVAVETETNGGVGIEYADFKNYVIGTAVPTQVSFTSAETPSVSAIVDANWKPANEGAIDGWDTEAGKGVKGLWNLVKSNISEFPSTSNFFEARGGQYDECHIMVFEKSGTSFELLEKFEYLSLAVDSTSLDGSNNFYKDVINAQSEYIYAVVAPSTFINAGNNSLYQDAGSGEMLPTSFSFGSSLLAAVNQSKPQLLSGGRAGEITKDDVRDAYDIFLDTENIEINLLIGGPTPSLPAGIVPSLSITDVQMTNAVSHAQQLISIAEQRRDCVAFISPPVQFTSNTNSMVAMDVLLQWVRQLSSSSYAVFDSSALYQYDKYNDTYRWNPACGAVAGLCAKTDDVADPWWSPAGFNRGQIFEVTRLGLNPTQTNRDDLYKNRLNPICAFPGEGTILYGDKTAQTKPSAFDRINVRRLFLVLEKAIATAAKYQLFEFNDEFTRAQFRNMVEPFLRDVKGRRGIYDFLVVCDETNNTGQVIDTNRFIADIYIKPARSINFMTLNFIATRTGVEFSEIVGKF